MDTVGAVVIVDVVVGAVTGGCVEVVALESSSAALARFVNGESMSVTSMCVIRENRMVMGWQRKVAKTRRGKYFRISRDKCSASPCRLHPPEPLAT